MSILKKILEDSVNADKEMEKLMNIGEEVVETSLILAIKELENREKENAENPGKYDPRSISIARTKIESAVLIYIENKEGLAKNFEATKQRNDIDLMSDINEAKRWFQISENLDKLKNTMKELREKELNQDELAAKALAHLMGIDLGEQCQ